MVFPGFFICVIGGASIEDLDRLLFTWFLTIFGKIFAFDFFGCLSKNALETFGF